MVPSSALSKYQHSTFVTTAGLFFLLPYDYYFQNYIIIIIAIIIITLVVIIEIISNY